MNNSNDSLYLQIYGFPTYFSQVYVSNELLDDCADLGNLGYKRIRPAIDQYADNVSRTQYAINAAVNNLYQAFCGQPYNLAVQLRELRTGCVNLLGDVNLKLITTLRILLQRAATLRRSSDNVDDALGNALEDAIQNGTSCISELGKKVSIELILRTASVASAAQKVSSSQISKQKKLLIIDCLLFWCNLA